MDVPRKSGGLGSRPALVVVDVIKSFTDPECVLGHECQSALVANQQLLQAFRERDLPVFFTTVVYYNDDQASVFRARLPALNILEAGSKWVELDPLMNRQPDEILIEKQWASSFHKTDLDSRLREAKVDSLIVTGLTTSGCVRATAVDGLQYNYLVTIAEEAVSDRNQHAHEATLHDLDAKYADVKSNAEIIDQLNQVKAA